MSNFRNRSYLKNLESKDFEEIEYIGFVISPDQWGPSPKEYFYDVVREHELTVSLFDPRSSIRCIINFENEEKRK